MDLRRNIISRQTPIQTDRHTDRQTDTHTDVKTSADRQIHRYTLNNDYRT